MDDFQDNVKDVISEVSEIMDKAFDFIDNFITNTEFDKEAGAKLPQCVSGFLLSVGASAKEDLEKVITFSHESPYLSIDFSLLKE